MNAASVSDANLWTTRVSRAWEMLKALTGSSLNYASCFLSSKCVVTTLGWFYITQGKKSFFVCVFLDVSYPT